LRFSLLAISAWTLLSFLFATQAFISSHYVLRPLTWGQALAVACVAWYLRGAFAVLVYWLARKVPFRSGRVVRAFAVHIATSLVIAFVEQIAFTAIITNVPWFSGIVPSPAEAQMNLLVYWGVVGVAHGVAYYTNATNSALVASRLQSQLATARLDLLRAQLHPHFLFNTLNDIAELMHEDPERADLMLTSLSDLLRETLRGSPEREVSLDREMAFVGRYLELAKMRFQDRLDVSVSLPRDLGEAMVPSLLLQPLVENAIRHGISRLTGPGRIDIAATRAGDRLRITVADNGPGLRAGSGDGLGLTNTRDRIREHFGRDGVFALKPADAGGVTASIEIPLRFGVGAVLPPAAAL
jgi:two-component system LytT family sensor kinase